MRLRRWSFVAGWAAIALLAALGFAAFGAPDDTAGDVDVVTAEASMGHTAGTYAGLSFAYLAGDLVAPGATEELSVPRDADLLSSAASPEQSPPTTSVLETIDANMWLSEIQVRALVELYFQPEDVNQAVRVAWCESRFNPSSQNLRSGAVGLFQHLLRYWPERAEAAGFPGADPTDPVASVAAAAYEVYHGGGWDVFTCRG